MVEGRSEELWMCLIFTYHNPLSKCLFQIHLAGCHSLLIVSQISKIWFTLPDSEHLLHYIAIFSIPHRPIVYFF